VRQPPQPDPEVRADAAGSASAAKLRTSASSRYATEAFGGLIPLTFNPVLHVVVVCMVKYCVSICGSGLQFYIFIS
jgi:hypothetical protein